MYKCFFSGKMIDSPLGRRDDCGNTQSHIGRLLRSRHRNLVADSPHKAPILSQNCWCLEPASCPARGLGQISLRVMGGEGTEGAVVAPCCQPVTSPAKSCEHISGLYHSLANRCMALDEAGSVVSLLIASLSRHT